MTNSIILLIFVLAIVMSSGMVSAGAYDDGFRAGEDAVLEMWEDRDEDCAEAWSLGRDATRTANRRFRGGRNNRKRTFNRAAREGVRQKVKAIEEMCFDRSDKECIYVAETAAENIVRRHFCKPKVLPMVMAGASSASEDYPDNCRRMAINNCPSKIGDTVRNWCPEKRLTVGRRVGLERKCRKEVNRLVDDMNLRH